MRYDMSTQTERYAKAHLRKKRWHKVLTFLSCIVVFCTVYALIIPAITLSEDPICGLEEHIHTDECYSQVVVPQKINCTFEIHEHSEDCKKDGEYICGYSDYVIHEHDENCYDENDKLICELSEIKEHTHTDSCYVDGKLVCTEKENIFHRHTDGCYTDGELTCGKTELLRHQHDEKCVVPAETQKVLICKLEEHQHDEILCYPEKTKKIFGEKISLKRERTYTAHICNENGVEIKDDDTLITLNGKLPSGLAVRAIPVDIVVDGTEPICAYDIKIYDSDGKIYEVDERDPIKVEISASALQQESDVMPVVCYVPENGGTQTLASETDDDTIIFETNHFSVYAVLAARVSQAGTWARLTTSINNASSGEVVRLTADFTVGTSTIEIPSGKNVVLDLNGHTLTCGTNSAAVPFKIASGGTLTLRDSTQQNETVSTVTDGNKYGRTAEVANNTLTYYVTESDVNNSDVGSTTETLVKHTVPIGGSIVGSSNDESIFYVDGGTFNMESGFIRGGAKRAVYLNSGTATLSGGYICGITRADSAKDATGFGAAACVNGGTLNVTGTVIAGNKAANGGAICAHNSSVVNIDGGIISGNTSTRTENSWESSTYRNGGGGIYADGSAQVTLKSGYITNNLVNATGYFDGGGAVFMSATSKFSIRGGYITGNEAASGGGIRTDFGKGSSVTIMGGFISGNIARTAEGGGVCIDNGGKGYITAGHITNNRIIQTVHWGGGGLFCANSAEMYIVDALITENYAGGLGGGVAGCSTGRISITMREGGALYDNTASGEHFSGDASTKNEDHKYAADDAHFLNYGFQDYYCALSSRVYGSMLGGHPAYWSGTVDGVPVSNVTWDLVSDSVLGLTSHPKEDGIIAAQQQAKVYINGNSSYTHGGGILSNGYLLIGVTDHIDIGSRLELSATKAFYAADGKTKALSEGQFKFKVVDESGAVVSNGVCKADGTISFDQRIPFNQAGTFIFYISEVQGEDSVVYDTTEYRMTVTVKETELSSLTGIDGNNESYNISRSRYDISSVKIDVRNGTGDWTNVYNNTNPGVHEDSALKISLPEESESATFANHEAQYINVVAKKEWSGTAGASSVTVYLLRNGERYDTKTLNASNNWSYTWSNLPLTGSGGAKYTYTIEEAPINGYYPTYTTINTSSGEQYWVPASSLESGKQYIIVNNAGGQALYITSSHENAGFTTADKKAVTRNSGTLTLQGQTYSTWYNVDNIDARSIFTAQTSTKNGNQGIILKCNGATNNTWLLVQNANNNHFKGTSGSQYASFFTFSNNTIKGQENYDWNPNDLRTVIYQNNKFNTTTSSTSSYAARLYTLVSGDITNTTTVVIKNTPVQETDFTLDIKKISAKDSNLYLAGAEFELLDSSGTPLHFIGSNGNYAYTEDSGAGTVVITATRGSMRLTGLPAGSYTLHETKAPFGYECVDKAITLDETLPNATLSLDVADPTTSYLLPKTGGAGTIMFSAGGLILVIGSLFVGCVLRRKRERRLS